MEFTEYLSWAKSVENTAISANKAASYLIAKTRSSSAFLFAIYNHLYTTLVLPVIEYNCFIWGLRPFDQISKIQNNLMKRFLGVGRNAQIVTLIGDMGWVPISIITKLSGIRFWQRLSNMFHDRLNYKIFTESCRLAENGKKNWASPMKVYLNYLNSHLGFRPSITDKHFLQYKI